MMQAVALLRQNPSPTRDEIKAYMNGNLCRCGTYMRIVRAIEDASESVKNS
ncbi:2Fe-2S iron-sulfur cluster-binding protein [Muriicola sp.]|uniref:2Fe-2S iron-sulfur cluster-binding protein n=1 Tax=Muriicola sp. TaxID=2020856 RepID=UPI0035694BBE